MNDSDSSVLERKEWLLWCESQMTRTANLLPCIAMGGWRGSPNGWLMYFPDWKKTRDLPLALISMFSAKTAAKRDSIKAEIINEFYGGKDEFFDYMRKMNCGITPFGHNQNQTEN